MFQHKYIFLFLRQNLKISVDFIISPGFLCVWSQANNTWFICLMFLCLIRSFTFFPVNGLVQVFWIWLQSNGLHTIPVALCWFCSCFSHSSKETLLLLPIKLKKLICVVQFSWLPQESCTIEMVLKVLFSHTFTKSVSAHEVEGPNSVFEAMCVQILWLCVLPC